MSSPTRLLADARPIRVTWRHIALLSLTVPTLACYLLEGVAAWVTVCVDLFRRWAGASLLRQALLVLLSPAALLVILGDAAQTWWRDGVERWRALS